MQLIKFFDYLFNIIFFDIKHLVLREVFIQNKIPCRFNCNVVFVCMWNG